MLRGEPKEQRADISEADKMSGASFLSDFREMLPKIKWSRILVMLAAIATPAYLIHRNADAERGAIYQKEAGDLIKRRFNINPDQLQAKEYKDTLDELIRDIDPKSTVDKFINLPPEERKLWLSDLGRANEVLKGVNLGKWYPLDRTVAENARYLLNGLERLDDALDRGKPIHFGQLSEHDTAGFDRFVQARFRNYSVLSPYEHSVTALERFQSDWNSW